jgi:hypothetical protein
VSNNSFAAHPIHFLSTIKQVEKDFTLSFSRYFYRPNSALDERVVIHVKLSEVTEPWLERQLRGLPPGWELAFNSVIVDSRSRTHHVGMIDFKGRPDIAVVRERAAKLLSPEISRSIIFYDSGRSYHGYIPFLLTPGKWRKFLARLLLINFVDEPEIIDSRWVGHRLLGGYCALRWSYNSDFHQHAPKLLETPPNIRRRREVNDNSESRQEELFHNGIGQLRTTGDRP